MNKSIIAIALMLAAAVGLLVMQSKATSVNTVNITKEDIESWLQIIPPQQLRAIAAAPDAKKQIVDNLKEIFSLSLEAERLGITSRPEIQSDLNLMEKVALAETFRNRKASEQPKAVEVTDAEKAEFYKNNPNAFDQFVAGNSRLKSAPAEQREALKPQYAELEILVERAKRMGLQNERGYQMNLRVQRASYLASRAQQELRNTTQVSDDDMRGFYDKNKDQFGETRARHILIMTPEARQQRAGAPQKPGAPATEEEAKKKAEDILARIKAGEDFAKLAKENSDDSSAEQGGDLGFFRKDVRFVPEFKDAVFKLKPGEVSEIVKTQFGYHIIKVDEQRTAPFDETMKADIKDRILEEKVQKRVDDLKAKNLVTIDENFTVPTPPPAPTPPPGAPQAGQPPAGANPHGNPHGADDGHGHGSH